MYLGDTFVLIVIELCLVQCENDIEYTNIELSHPTCPEVFSARRSSAVVENDWFPLMVWFAVMPSRYASRWAVVGE